MKKVLLGTIFSTLITFPAFSMNHHLSFHNKNLSFIKTQSGFVGKTQTIFDLEKNDLPEICLELGKFIDAGTEISVMAGTIADIENDDDLKMREIEINEQLLNLPNVCEKPKFGKAAADNLKKLVEDLYLTIVEVGLYHTETYRDEILKME